MSGAKSARPGLRDVCAGILLLALLSSGISRAASLRDPRIEHLTIEDGLPDGTIYSAAQDPHGFLWFGTQYGLARYDGYTFEVYVHDPSDPDSISTQLASDVLVDRRGRLWVATWGGGLERYEPSIDGFRHFRPGAPGGLADSRVQTLFEDGDGALWIGTYGGGLQRFDGDDDASAASDGFRTFPHDANDAATLSHDRVWDIAESDDGSLWIATSAGVDRLDPSTGRVERNAVCLSDAPCLPHEQVRALLVDRDGALWIGTREGLVVMLPEGGRELYRAGDRGLADDSVNTLFEDHTGRVWVGTVFGGAQVWESEAERFRGFSADGGPRLGGQDVRFIFEDWAGLVWIGTRGDGVIKLDPRNQFKRLMFEVDDASGVSSGARVSSVATTSDRWGWAGGPGGLTRFDRLNREMVPIRAASLAPGGVTVLHVDSHGDLWLGTELGGVQRVERAHEASERVTFRSFPNRAFDGQPVRAIVDGPGGELWIGTANAVFILDVRNARYRFELQTGDVDGGELELDSLTALRFDPNGGLWIGTQYDGIARYQPTTGSVERFPSASGEPNLPGNSVLSLFVDRHGTLWAGTRSAGLARWEASDGAFKSYGILEGLASNTVYGIAEDEKSLWVSTTNGLSRWDTRDGAVRNFGMIHGLQRMSFLAGAVHRALDGEIFFGGRQGLVSFRPDEIADSGFVPPVLITGVRLFGRTMATEQPVWVLPEIQLGPEDDYLSIEFAALDFTEPRGNRFQYRLDGFDREWVDAGTRREAQYTNLDGGIYTFRVRGSNHDGVWNEREATLEVRVVPSWWERTSFKVALSFGAFLALALAARRRLQQVRGVQQSLEALVGERTRELEAKTEELQASYRVVEELSYTDALTGLKNRRFFDETIELELARVARQYEQQRRQGAGFPKQVDLLFVLVDLDRFKLVNDTFGHRAGDDVLRQLGGLLRTTCRDADLVVRWGGEEFLLVLRSTDREHAPKLVEQLRLAVESRAFDLVGGKHLDITCSLGFSVFPFDPLRPRLVGGDSLLELADRALYEAKRLGRNTWVGISLGGSGTGDDPVTDLGGRVSAELTGERLVWIRPEAGTPVSRSRR